MKKIFLLSLLLGALAAPAFARNDAYFLKWADVVDAKDGAVNLDGSVKFYFGEGSGPAGVERDGDEVVQIAKGKGYSREMREIDIQGCKMAALAALGVYQQRARQKGYTAVVDLVSNYHNSKFSSPTEYECHAGGTGSHVQFKANYAR
jgi:hypothetical protein